MTTVGAKVLEAKRAGILIPADTCELCDRRIFTVAHHEDYGRPLDVNWLCTSCHSWLHGARNSGKEVVLGRDKRAWKATGLHRGIHRTDLASK